MDSALWTCRLLGDYLAEQTGHRAGTETVRIALHRAGHGCKRPRWVLSHKAQAQVLSQIGSPFAPGQQPVLRKEPNHAA